MFWPCNHRWGQWNCCHWVETLGSSCVSCQFAAEAKAHEAKNKGTDPIPTHIRVAKALDVEYTLEALRDRTVRANLVVELMGSGSSEQALREALEVIQKNDAEWHDRDRSAVLQGIYKYKWRARRPVSQVQGPVKPPAKPAKKTRMGFQLLVSRLSVPLLGDDTASLDDIKACCWWDQRASWFGRKRIFW